MKPTILFDNVPAHLAAKLLAVAKMKSPGAVCEPTTSAELFKIVVEK